MEAFSWNGRLGTSVRGGNGRAGDPLGAGCRVGTGDHYGHGQRHIGRGAARRDGRGVQSRADRKRSVRPSATAPGSTASRTCARASTR